MKYTELCKKIYQSLHILFQFNYDHTQNRSTFYAYIDLKCINNMHDCGCTARATFKYYVLKQKLNNRVQ